MDIKALKLEIMQQLLATESEELLKKVQQLFLLQEDFELTDDQKQMLDERRQRYLTGEGENHSWEEVKEAARKALKN